MQTVLLKKRRKGAYTLSVVLYYKNIHFRKWLLIYQKKGSNIEGIVRPKNEIRHNLFTRMEFILCSVEQKHMKALQKYHKSSPNIFCAIFQIL